jgi:hypothetical protein
MNVLIFFWKSRECRGKAHREPRTQASSAKMEPFTPSAAYSETDYCQWRSATKEWQMGIVRLTTVIGALLGN